MYSNLGQLGNRLLQWVTDQVPGLVNRIGQWIKSFVDFPVHVVEQLPNELSNVLKAINEWVDSILPRLVSKGEEMGKSMFTGIISGLGRFASGVLGDLGIGGGSSGGHRNYDPQTGQYYANGTMNAPGGMAWVGERGPELVNLPAGAQVFTADQSRRMASGGTAPTINVYVAGSITTARGMAEDVRTELLRMQRQGIKLGFVAT
jgi:hypothetical protein